jgi:hypothetical protein
MCLLREKEKKEKERACANDISSTGTSTTIFGERNCKEENTYFPARSTRIIGPPLDNPMAPMSLT